MLHVYVTVTAVGATKLDRVVVFKFVENKKDKNAIQHTVRSLVTTINLRH